MKFNRFFGLCGALFVVFVLLWGLIGDVEQGGSLVVNAAPVGTAGYSVDAASCSFDDISAAAADVESQ